VLLLLPHSARADTLPSYVTVSICGDGIVNAGEVCDAGIAGNSGAYGSSTAERYCAPGCFAWGPYCGDDILQVRYEEECDDGNNTSGDLCTAACKEEVPAPPGSSGSPQVGVIPVNPGAPAGIISALGETKVVLRGKAYPNTLVNVVVDGKLKGTARADANANFLFSATDITPGTATFGFWANDPDGTQSITTSMVFEVVQSAVTTVANIYFPPTIKATPRQVAPGGLLTLAGFSVPAATVVTEIAPGVDTILNAPTDAEGKWALQVDTRSITDGFHTAKSFFELSGATRSGYGKAVNFFVGEGSPTETGSSDLNGDGKVNLVDFSIFLLAWGTDDSRSDFNLDGIVNLGDFSIMLFNWTG
jgi:cysteine-rich repeat protein